MLLEDIAEEDAEDKPEVEVPVVEAVLDDEALVTENVPVFVPDTEVVDKTRLGSCPGKVSLGRVTPALSHAVVMPSIFSCGIVKLLEDTAFPRHS